jgi:hypothetical protein
VNCLQKFGLVVLHHPLYSSELAPGVYYLFGPLNKHFVTYQFKPDFEVLKAIKA